MKHAFLIIAHDKWEQLIYLLKQLDSTNHDIFIHIDKKCKNIPFETLKSTVNKSKIEIYSYYKVYWGSFELVETEIFLLEQAFKKQYDYYHLLSGADLMIKSNKYLDDFFEKNKGKEFVHFDTEQRLKEDKELERRTKYYHFFTNYRRKFKIALLNEFFTFIARLSLILQMIIGIDRSKKNDTIKIKYGSQWFSITNDLVNYIIQSKAKIYSMFKYTKCADELFIQTLVYNSKFQENLYDKNFDDSNIANMRLIDMKKRGKRGSPYTWRLKDFKEINDSQCIFARKFNIDIDSEIIKQIIKLTMSKGEKSLYGKN